jgi:hypothetical protein
MTLRSLSDPAPPHRLVDISEEGKGKAKERREVGEGDDTVTIEDTTDEDDGGNAPGAVSATVQVQPTWATPHPPH